MTSLTARLLLAASGVLLIAIGSAILFEPHAFFATNGIQLGHDPNLLSEIRAPGGLLIGCGAFIALNAFRPRARRSALGLAMMVYGTFSLSRLVSMSVDGAPSYSLLFATALELLIGGACAIAYFRNPLATVIPPLPDPSA